MQHTRTSAKGLLPNNLCGATTISLTLFLRLSLNVFLPLAFSIIPLSIIVMIGAINTPADPAASASAPSLKPKFFVFHDRDDSLSALCGATEDGGSADGILGFGMARVSQGAWAGSTTLWMAACGAEDGGISAGTWVAACVSPIATFHCDVQLFLARCSMYFLPRLFYLFFPSPLCLNLCSRSLSNPLYRANTESPRRTPTQNNRYKQRTGAKEITAQSPELHKLQRSLASVLAPRRQRAEVGVTRTELHCRPLIGVCVREPPGRHVGRISQGSAFPREGTVGWEICVHLGDGEITWGGKG